MDLGTIIILILLCYILFIHLKSFTCSENCYPNWSIFKIFLVFILGIILGYLLAPKKKDKSM